MGSYAYYNTIAVLTPIATGEIGFSHLKEALMSLNAWIALASGVFVAVVAKHGIILLENEPHITTAIVIGTVAGVSLLKGIAVGPIIGAGIAYLLIKLVS